MDDDDDDDLDDHDVGNNSFAASPSHGNSSVSVKNERAEATQSILSAQEVTFKSSAEAVAAAATGAAAQAKAPAAATAAAAVAAEIALGPDEKGRPPAWSATAAAAALEHGPKRRGRPPGGKNSPRLPTKSPPAAETGEKKRGRPPGSKDTKPRQPHQKKQKVFTSEREKKKVEAARRRIDQSQKKLEAAEAKVARLQKMLEEAKEVAEKAKEVASKTIEAVADVLLLEPEPWNKYYRLLVEFKEREGHVEFRRVDPHYANANASYNALPPDARKEYKTLARWLSRQRTARRRGALEKHQLFLLDRVGINWTPSHGPGPEKWTTWFEKIKEYKRAHGDCRVPRNYPPEPKLAQWVRSQVGAYRNARAGKKPALTEDRTRLLEGIGFDWGVPQMPTPWEFRFQELRRYLEQHGHPNVPWKWDGNRPLAYWVVKQRNMYKLISDGKKAPITAEQIQKLNSIGFQWNAGGKRAYDRPEKQQGQDENDFSNDDGVDGDELDEEDDGGGKRAYDRPEGQHGPGYECNIYDEDQLDGDRLVGEDDAGRQRVHDRLEQPQGQGYGSTFVSHHQVDGDELNDEDDTRGETAYDRFQQQQEQRCTRDSVHNDQVDTDELDEDDDSVNYGRSAR